MIDATYFLALLFVFVRLTSFFAITKVFFPNGTPKTLKMFFSLIFSFAILGGVDNSNIELINNNLMLIMYILSEASTGIILGIITNLAFEVVLMAGSLMDVHIGLSMVSVLDPNTKTNTTVFGNLLHYVSMIIFFLIDGHHMIIKSLIESFILVPLGKNILYKETMMAIIDIIAKYFAIGLKIAIPIVLIIIITDISMGLISRAVPQINVMILGMPVKILVGLIAVSISLPIVIKVFISSISYIPEIFRKIMTVAPLLFIISADEKTEEATPKKKSDARKKGQIARSKDVGLALTMLTVTLVIMGLSTFLVNTLKGNIIYFLNDAGVMKLTEDSIKGINLLVTSKMAVAIIPIVVPIMLAGVVASLMQTGFLVTKDAIKPSFGKLNPINGFKNMFSKKAMIDLIKNIIMVSIVAFIGYSYVKDNFSSIIQIGNLYLPTLGVEVKNLVLGIFTKITILLIALAAIDYFVQFRLYNKDLRMTKQEVKEEYKQMEGDPQLKSKIKQKQREMSQRRMMQSVGDATVVITNPTHLAVAIKYEDGENEAPRVIAKGADNIAMKIKELAKESEVPIIENKPLARLIYNQVEIDEEIPQDMYQAVAEILAMVYKLNQKKRKVTRK
ncbi:fused FliR family export protein/FlhB family type III secretion system protein [Clostridium septicum]|uniref:Flagellar biosynthetic protein FliR n=1 Tax=Clostridium septicum TaxID=1504 RepID=A0A9N7PJX1_CLOSE|nr:fused FliR family export protein/FlhB family type III secretion system protein [Clostridium septicum]AYE33417.1 flagellar biosynthetic protein FlhB [Clostridium septicum]QAS61591.1 fused FliR family export protein/FlhB family type III secretion system protein [Clostridium septicum]UEC21973.1 fused FliR family export protein/FlhB family type III secretion system protein [Clostridium septicum]USR99995.1 fused FliR family export protein/FlhB family type III secretion system protein [Clostridium